jgi:hypothetical protein
MLVQDRSIRLAAVTPAALRAPMSRVIPAPACALCLAVAIP